MLALSIRQPYAEMILRGEKTIEYRSRATKMIGKRFYIYASKSRGRLSVASCQNGHEKNARCEANSAPSACGGGDVADQSAILPNIPGDVKSQFRNLPTGLIVGTATIAKCERENGHYCWHLSKVKRLPKPRRPKRQPQPVWFRPF